MFYFDVLPRDIIHIILSKLDVVASVVRSGVIQVTLDYEVIFRLKFPKIYKSVKFIIDDHFTMYAENIDMITYDNLGNELHHMTSTPNKVVTLHVDKWFYALHVINLKYGGISTYLSRRLSFYERYPELYVLLIRDKSHVPGIFRHDTFTFMDPAFAALVKGSFVDFEKLSRFFEHPMRITAADLYMFASLDNYLDVFDYLTSHIIVEAGISPGHMTDPRLVNRVFRYIVETQPSMVYHSFLYQAYIINDENLFNYMLGRIRFNLHQALVLLIANPPRNLSQKSMFRTLQSMIYNI